MNYLKWRLVELTENFWLEQKKGEINNFEQLLE